MARPYCDVNERYVKLRLLTPWKKEIVTRGIESILNISWRGKLRDAACVLCATFVPCFPYVLLQVLVGVTLQEMCQERDERLLQMKDYCKSLSIECFSVAYACGGSSSKAKITITVAILLCNVAAFLVL